ncbi:MAG: hypothetical protein LBN42_03445 [Oscillospiraceae bacterium]|jgi:hypothetical protein|nr:hypothetical protein [Oscillospiraceae bacterium]
MNELSYKNRPLLRKGNEIFYGEPSTGYICYIKIQSEKTVKSENKEKKDEVTDITVPETLEVQLVECADGSIKFTEQKVTRTGFSNALTTADIWLGQKLR